MSGKLRAGDVDVDMPDRSLILHHIRHIPAAMRNVTPIKKHSSGIYVGPIPYDPAYDMAAIDYAEAEERGYFKLDLLNVYLYTLVRDEAHLLRLMRQPDWSQLKYRKFVDQLIHLNNHFGSVRRMPEPIDSIPKLAMMLALIRPAKRHLIGLPWSEVEKTVWDKDSSGEYGFKKAHAYAHGTLVVVNMNLISEGITMPAEVLTTIPSFSPE
jgi:hypothetical protein